jgi:hypothetical protein
LFTSMRSLADIRLDIERATDRRAELWHELSVDGFNAEARAEVERLNEEIAKLWDEQRELRARVRFGDRDKIVQRARAEERLNRAA